MRKKKDLELYISQALAYRNLLKETNNNGKHTAKLKSVDQKIKQARFALRLRS
jgi:hypothetical protein